MDLALFPTHFDNVLAFTSNDVIFDRGSSPMSSKRYSKVVFAFLLVFSTDSVTVFPSLSILSEVLQSCIGSSKILSLFPSLFTESSELIQSLTAKRDWTSGVRWIKEYCYLSRDFLSSQKTIVEFSN